MTLIDTSAPSELLNYLPSIYHREFLSRYLTAFERILIGRNDGIEIPGNGAAGSRSLEETINSIPLLFDPHLTPPEFLPWLASWAALALRADLDEKQQRDFLGQIIQLYRRRGTKDNLIQLLKIYTKTTPQIDEEATPSDDFKKQYPQFNSDARPLDFFRVSILLTNPSPDTVQRIREIASALIDMEKPVHTFYELETKFESMRIGTYADQGTYHATLGIDTLINSEVMVTPGEPKQK